MRWPAARISSPDQRVTIRLLLFAAAELLLAMAIPFLLIRGYHTLLSSNAGTFVDGPTADEPGWSALVSATPITTVVEVADGMVTGAALIVPAQSGGTVILAPGDLSVPIDIVPTDGTGPGTSPETPMVLSGLDPTRAAEALSRLVNLDVAETVVVDESVWADALGDTVYQLDNPDPVPLKPLPLQPADSVATPPAGNATDKSPMTDLAFAVGPVAVDGANAAVFAGRPVDGAGLSSVMARRKELWSAMVKQPPGGDNPLVRAILSVKGSDSTGTVLPLPVINQSDAISVDGVEAELLLRDVVAFPSGRRLEVRLVDRTGRADLEHLAAWLAGRGIEVVEIANAVQFDNGTSEVIRPPELGVGGDQLDDLAARLGLSPLVDPETEDDIITILVGHDFDVPDG